MEKLFPKSIETKIWKDISLKYLEYKPKGYAESEEEFPLILFLHGMGERGSDLDLLKLYGLPKLIDKGEEYPFIIVSPQCPENAIWANEIDTLITLLQHVVENNRVDISRIYLTGLSMGGNGTWHLASAYPSLFAAIAPICGWGDPYFGFPEKVSILNGVPVWAFHGEEDTVIPMQRSQELVDVLKEYGGNVNFTVYPNTDHDSWSETYENPELYKWFLQHKNENNFELNNLEKSRI